MIAALKSLGDRILGRGDASITVPIFDGALKPNQILADAEAVDSFDDANDIASDGRSLLVADGGRIVSVGSAGKTEVARFDDTVTALCALPDGGVAAALGGREIRIVGGAADGRRWSGPEGGPLHAVNAIACLRDGRLAVSDGSQRDRKSVV